MFLRRRSRLRALGVAAVAALALTACGQGNINTAGSGGNGNGSGSGGGSATPCGQVNIAVNPWVGYEADAYVVGTLAKQKLGCTVSYKNLSEQVSWEGFASGTVDVVLENWGHQDLVQKYIKQQHVAEVAGQTGNIGVIGWFVPPWLAKAHPDVLNWKNLNKYASKFATSESGGKGQLLDGDPSYVTNDAALVQNLHLNFKVVYAGSEAALIQAFRQAQQHHTWMIGYFYSPQWFLSEVPLKQVQLPPYKPGCDTVASKVACGYPLYHLDKIVSTKFAQSGSPAYKLVKNFHWTNDQQNIVAKYIAEDGMSPTAAAEKWIKANPKLVAAWLKGT
jgi:glycine betaine/proline transport system substrate-binding protein